MLVGGVAGQHRLATGFQCGQAHLAETTGLETGDIRAGPDCYHAGQRSRRRGVDRAHAAVRYAGPDHSHMQLVWPV
jgi:hypothetical protein